MNKLRNAAVRRFPLIKTPSAVTTAGCCWPRVLEVGLQILESLLVGEYLVLLCLRLFSVRVGGETGPVGSAGARCASARTASDGSGLKNGPT